MITSDAATPKKSVREESAPARIEHADYQGLRVVTRITVTQSWYESNVDVKYYLVDQWGKTLARLIDESFIRALTIP